MPIKNNNIIQPLINCISNFQYKVSNIRIGYALDYKKNININPLIFDKYVAYPNKIEKKIVGPSTNTQEVLAMAHDMRCHPILMHQDSSTTTILGTLTHSATVFDRRRGLIRTKLLPLSSNNKEYFCNFKGTRIFIDNVLLNIHFVQHQLSDKMEKEVDNLLSTPVYDCNGQYKGRILNMILEDPTFTAYISK